MESGFLHNLGKAESWSIGGFYPCFNGIRVLTVHRLHQLYYLKQVSILVLMESGFLPVLTFGIAFATIIAHVFII